MTTSGSNSLSAVRSDLLTLLRSTAAFEYISIHEDTQLLNELSAFRKQITTFRKAHHLDGPKALAMHAQLVKAAKEESVARPEHASRKRTREEEGAFDSESTAGRTPAKRRALVPKTVNMTKDKEGSFGSGSL